LGRWWSHGSMVVAWVDGGPGAWVDGHTNYVTEDAFVYPHN